MRRSPLLLLALLFASCPADLDLTPAFLTVTEFELATAVDEGAPTTAITEVWAFADEEFIGVFPLPARIPILKVGSTDIRLEAGIRQDGRSATPDVYPFYAPYTRTLELVGGQTIDLGVLPIRYRDETVFGLVEDFESDRNRVFTQAIAGSSTLVAQRTVVRSGAAAGAISLADTNRLVELASAQTFVNLNQVPINVWLEVDYQSDAPGVFGVIGQRDGLTVRVFDPGFLPRSGWTKIYFNLGPVVGSADLTEFRIALSVLLDAERAAGTVYLDNLKLLYLRP